VGEQQRNPFLKICELRSGNHPVRPEDRILFACTRQDFTDAHRQAVLEISRKHSLSWEMIFSKAEQHGVAPLVYLNLCQGDHLDINIPEPIVNRYRLFAMRNTVRKEQRAQRTLQALEYFNAQSIDVMLIKGAALDLLVYDHAMLITSNDIDFVLKRRREELSPDHIQKIMSDLHQSGIEYDFYSHHDMTINGALPVDFERIWQEAEQIDYRGQPVWLMSAEDMLISVCINSCRKRFFRLKSLLDISETLCKIGDIRWDVVVEKSRSYDCHNIVYTALLVCQQTLGCRLPQGALQSLGLNPLRRAVINSMVKFLIRYISLPAAPNAGRSLLGKQVHISLMLPYASYRFYQIRHKLFDEIL
jgi:hypothetical protein